MNFNQNTGIDGTAARKYFKGAGLIPIVLISVGLLFGIIFVFVSIPPSLLFFGVAIAGSVWKISVWLATDAFEREVDEIISISQEFLIERSADKLSVIDPYESDMLVEPIQVIGPSYQPSNAEASQTGLGIGGILNNVHASLQNAPILVRKIGKDNKMRSSLIESTSYIFGETELLIYFAHVDVTSGLIFHEGTHEYFYKDICGITTDQVLISVFSPVTQKYEYRMLEFIEISTNGCKHRSTFDSNVNEATLDNQFTAMRNLIRSKKNEK